MNWDDFINSIKQGGPSVIIILSLGIALFVTRRLRFPDEVTNEKERRIEELKYRDEIIARREEHIERQSSQIDRLQDNFEVALKSIREDMLPLIDRAISELRNTGSNR
jgi:phenylpropionate dioxygenase-like ring-hydroxylating dioxygenase large terminal subunit